MAYILYTLVKLSDRIRRQIKIGRVPALYLHMAPSRQWTISVATQNVDHAWTKLGQDVVVQYYTKNTGHPNTLAHYPWAIAHEQPNSGVHIVARHLTDQKHGCS